MLIDAIRFKLFTPQIKKRCFKEGLCLYCEELGDESDSCIQKNTTTLSIKEHNYKKTIYNKKNKDIHPQ